MLRRLQLNTTNGLKISTNRVNIPNTEAIAGARSKPVWRAVPSNTYNKINIRKFFLLYNKYNIEYSGGSSQTIFVTQEMWAINLIINFVYRNSRTSKKNWHNKLSIYKNQ